MNIFSNIGITELLIILLLALVVVGPERLPEMGRKIGETLRDLRKAYDNLTGDLGPELMSIQQTTQELRDSVDSITSIPQDMVQTVVKAAELDDTIDDLKGVAGSVSDMGKTLSSAGKVIQDPVNAAVSTAKDALVPSKPSASSGAAPDAANGPVRTQKPDAIAGDAAGKVVDLAEDAIPAGTGDPQALEDDVRGATDTLELERAEDSVPFNTEERDTAVGDSQGISDE